MAWSYLKIFIDRFLTTIIIIVLILAMIVTFGMHNEKNYEYVEGIVLNTYMNDSPDDCYVVFYVDNKELDLPCNYSTFLLYNKKAKKKNKKTIKLKKCIYTEYLLNIQIEQEENYEIFD